MPKDSPNHCACRTSRREESVACMSRITISPLPLTHRLTRSMVKALESRESNSPTNSATPSPTESQLSFFSTLSITSSLSRLSDLPAGSPNSSKPSNHVPQVYHGLFLLLYLCLNDLLFHRFLAVPKLRPNSPNFKLRPLHWELRPRLWEKRLTNATLSSRR